MRIAMFMSWEGVTTQQYDQVRKLVDWDYQKPKGGILHVAAFDSNGLRVTDIWESEADLNNFVEKRLLPKVEQIGVTTPPKVEVYPLHNLFTPGL